MQKPYEYDPDAFAKKIRLWWHAAKAEATNDITDQTIEWVLRQPKDAVFKSTMIGVALIMADRMAQGHVGKAYEAALVRLDQEYGLAAAFVSSVSTCDLKHPNIQSFVARMQARFVTPVDKAA